VLLTFSVKNASVQLIAVTLQKEGEKCSQSVEGEEFTLPALVSSDIHTEWMTFRRYITTQPEEDIMKLLMELATNSMLVQMIPQSQ